MKEQQIKQKSSNLEALDTKDSKTSLIKKPKNNIKSIQHCLYFMSSSKNLRKTNGF